jgi:lipopolysaccharide transport protein LptA
MANSLAKPTLCALALAASALAAQDRRAPLDDLVLDMQSFEIDTKTKLIKLYGPKITQGDMSIAADEALATDMESRAKSEWRFNRNVRITVASTLVTSDSAVFAFDEKGQLSRGELAGQATFEDPQPGRKEPARGGASKIIYDYAERTLRLTENAWFQSEGVHAQGCDIVYNLDTEGLKSGSSDCADRFQMRFPPKQQEDDRAAVADPPQ